MAEEHTVTDSERFIAALERGDLKTIRAVPKGDLHNHLRRNSIPSVP